MLNLAQKVGRKEHSLTLFTPNDALQNEMDDMEYKSLNASANS